MKAKKFIALIAAIATVCALAGCSLSREVASLDPYAPSDGVQVDTEALKARNVMFVVDVDGNAVLIGSFINPGQGAVSATLETMDSNGTDAGANFGWCSRGVPRVYRLNLELVTESSDGH